MGQLFFEPEYSSSGTMLRLRDKPLLGRARSVPIEEWPRCMAERAFSGVSKLLALLDDADGNATPELDGVRIAHHAIASLTEPQALGLGLPPSVRQALQIDTKNLLTDPDFRISGRWIGDGGRNLQVRREGAFVLIDGKRYRLPAPLYGLVEAIEALALPDNADNDARMERVAKLQSLLPDGLTDQLSVDSYFSSFRVLHASAFSLSLRPDGQSFDFDPVLFGRRVLDRISDTEAYISEAEGLLTEHQQHVFSDQRFRSSDFAKPSYVIERGVYVHLDRALRDGLNVVRRMQLADAPTRKRFVQKPQLYLKEALSDSLSEEEIERLFIETEQYSERVVDIGVWTPPVLPWIKRDPNDWLPEKFGVQIGGQYVVLTPDELGPLSERISDARANGNLRSVALHPTWPPATEITDVKSPPGDFIKDCIAFET
jgi:hypothetical protein